jgi:hypothetical protein
MGNGWFYNYIVTMQGGSSIEKNLKDFEALLEKCNCEKMQTRTTLRRCRSSTR